MQKIFYFIFSALFFSSFLQAAELKTYPMSQELTQSLPAELENSIQESLDKNENNGYGWVWVCGSAWVGPTGTWTYYGWAYNQTTAYFNAANACRVANRFYPQFCVVTGCYYRAW